MKKKQWLIFAILIIVIAYIEFVIYYLGNKDNIKIPDLKQSISNNKTHYVANKLKSRDKKPAWRKGLLNTEYITIKVNPPVSLSYKTKEEIYNIRKSYVAASIFASDNYNPSEAVFGQIEDNKPWWSTNITCMNEKGEANVAGPSEEARFIVNPAFLVGITPVDLSLRTGGNEKWCDEHENHVFNSLNPRLLTYNKSKNKITADCTGLPFITNQTYQLAGINARDFGYNYVYMDLKKSQIHNITFIQENNVSNEVQEFKDFFHTGGACQVAGGCNNASPYSPELAFNMQMAGTAERRTYKFILKLWKNKPQSPDDEADITEQIVFMDINGR